MKIDGACHCGYIRYEAEVDPDKVMICHCTDCQTLSGSAFRTVVVTLEDSFRLLAGTLKVYVKTGENGNQRTQTFCPECGTPIYSSTTGEGPKRHVIRVGTIRQRNALTPKRQLWSRSAQPWIAGLNSIPRIETQPPFDATGGMQ